MCFGSKSKAQPAPAPPPAPIPANDPIDESKLPAPSSTSVAPTANPQVKSDSTGLNLRI
jgi:hypothetical protein